MFLSMIVELQRSQIAEDFGGGADGENFRPKAVNGSISQLDLK